jgi:hypothetical protein
VRALNRKEAGVKEAGVKEAGVKEAGVAGVASGVAIVTLAIGRATERAAVACMPADRGGARAVLSAAVSRGCEPSV